jgi:hypothetical protein
MREAWDTTWWQWCNCRFLHAFMDDFGYYVYRQNSFVDTDSKSYKKLWHFLFSNGSH